MYSPLMESQCPPLRTTRPASPESLIEPADVHTAHFATRWLQPDTAVITAHGEIDAANAQELVDYALRHGDRINRLVLDMSGVEFFGTSGFSALHTLNVRCAGGSPSLGPRCPAPR